MLTGERRWGIKRVSNATQPMSEEQLKSSLDAEGAIPLEEGPDEELTDEELENVAGGVAYSRREVGSK
jgi:bacteriocin-like protein